MKEERKSKGMNAIKICSFLILVGFIFTMLFCFARPNVPNKTHTFRTYDNSIVFKEKENSIDVLYVGHSRVFSGISPMEIYDEYGFAGHNCAQSLQLPWESYDLICDILQKQSPKVIALEADQFFYTVKNAEFRSNMKNTALKMFPFIETHFYWKDNFGYAKDNPFKNYKFRTGVDSGTENNNMDPTDARAKMPKRFKKAFDKILKLCKEKEIQVVFFTIPSLEHWNYAMFNSINDISNSLDIPFVDMNQKEILQQLNMDWKLDTRDKGDHLNHSGACKVSKYFGAWLKDHTNLEDRRGQAEYENWNKDLKEYKKLVQKGCKK